MVDDEGLRLNLMCVVVYGRIIRTINIQKKNLVHQRPIILSYYIRLQMVFAIY